MNVEHFETFSASYRRNLKQAVKDNPGDYALGRLGFESDPERFADTTADKMLASIRERGLSTINKDGEGFKRTCKELGIKHTYKAIEAYLNGE